MKLVPIGFGEWGAIVVDTLLENYQALHPGLIQAPTVITTSHEDLEALRHVPADHQHWIGQSRTDNEPLDGDYVLGAKIVQDDLYEILGLIEDVPATQTDGFLFVTELADGLGSGGIPVLAEHLSEMYPDQLVLGLGILPVDADPETAPTVIRAIDRFQDTLDSLLLFDAAKWRERLDANGDDHGPDGAVVSEATKRLGLLITAAEPDVPGGTEEPGTSSGPFAEAFAEGGLAAVGYAVDRLESAPSGSQGLFDRFQFSDSVTIEEEEAGDRFLELVKRAAGQQCSVTCDIRTADEVVFVVGGMEAYLTDATVRAARSWLAERAGHPSHRVVRRPFRDSENLVAMIVATGLTGVPRIEQLREMIAAEATSDAEPEEPDEVTEPTGSLAGALGSRRSMEPPVQDIVSEEHSQVLRDFLRGDIETIPGLDPSAPEATGPPGSGAETSSEIVEQSSGPGTREATTGAGDSEPAFGAAIRRGLEHSRNRVDSASEIAGSVATARARVARLTATFESIPEPDRFEDQVADITTVRTHHSVVDVLDAAATDRVNAVGQAIEAISERQVELREGVASIRDRTD